MTGVDTKAGITVIIGITKNIGKEIVKIARKQSGVERFIAKVLNMFSNTSLPKRINPPIPLFQKYKVKHPQTQVPSNPPLLTVEFTNQSNTSLIPSVTMPQFFGTLSPFK